MTKEEFLDIYEKLDPIGRADVLNRAKFAYDIQESTERRCREVIARAQEALRENYGILDESTKQPTDNRPAA